MRVLMLDSESSWRGGQNQLALLMRGLESQGVEVTLAAPADAAIAAKAAESGIATRPLAIRGGMDVLAARRLAGLLDTFDIVHCHSSHAHSIAFLATWNLLSGRRRQRPALVVSRRVDFPFARHGASALKYRQGADLYLAISNGVRDVLVAGGVDPQRIALVPSGIDLERHRAIGDTSYVRDEFALQQCGPLIGNVAALAPHKSQVDFIRAARIVAEQVEDARFLIVGEGELRGELESMIRELGMQDRILLTGFRSDALAILASFDLFVLSSYLEGLCTSIMDAQVLGVPVVATNTGGVPDLVQHEHTGLLSPPRRPEALAAAILRLLREPGLRDRCVANARKRSPEYDFHHMVRRTAEAYRRVLGRQGQAVRSSS
ncbi:MAG: glycosyltransferase [Candidatus Latescibacterota bacterium]|nr:MAG: glycosyltransferase [Candidatus Latescibacterota bacterium]